MKKLRELIEDIVIPDIEDHIDDIFEEIANDKNANDDVKKELALMHEMRDEFTKILNDIENNELEQDECIELYEEINEMIKSNSEDEE
jgi:hypothetical protein